jgi:hypothetical protein
MQFREIGKSMEWLRTIGLDFLATIGAPSQAFPE